MKAIASFVTIASLLGGCHKVFDLDEIQPPEIDAAPPAYVAVVLADHPVAYFRLGEAIGVRASDEIASGFSGTYVGNVKFGQPGAIAGDTDTAIACDGLNCGVELGDVFDFADRAPYSLEAWLRPQFDGGFHNIISKWLQPGTSLGWDFYHQDAIVSMARELSPTDHDLISGTGLTDGVYAHVVGTFDGVMMTIYIDGMQRAQGAASRVLPDTQTSLFIASGNGAPTGGPVNGLIDDVAIYDHALAGERVNAHYQAGAR